MKIRVEKITVVYGEKVSYKYDSVNYELGVTTSFDKAINLEELDSPIDQITNKLKEKVNKELFTLKKAKGA